MRIKKVEGKNNKYKVLIYALSTCMWCTYAKRLLRKYDVEHEYIDVDYTSEKEKKEIEKDIISKGGTLHFPIIIIDDKIVINGFKKDKILEVLEIGNAWRSP